MWDVGDTGKWKGKCSEGHMDLTCMRYRRLSRTVNYCSMPNVELSRQFLHYCPHVTVDYLSQMSPVTFIKGGWMAWYVVYCGLWHPHSTIHDTPWTWLNVWSRISAPLPKSKLPCIGHWPPCSIRMLSLPMTLHVIWIVYTPTSHKVSHITAAGAGDVARRQHTWCPLQISDPLSHVFCQVNVYILKIDSAGNFTSYLLRKV